MGNLRDKYTDEEWFQLEEKIASNPPKYNSIKRIYNDNGVGYQICPLCKGSGIGPSNNINTTTVCTVCKGSKIINKFTGKPPTE